MPRFTIRSTAELIVLAVVFGALGAGLIWIGMEERIEAVASIGMTFAGTALAMAIFAIARLLRALFRRSRDVAAREYGEYRRVLRPALLVTTVLLSFLAILVTHNYIAWSRIERDCELALEAEDLAEAELAFRRGTAAMESPLLVIPSDLLDLWGPNRCRSAAGRFDPVPSPR